MKVSELFSTLSQGVLSNLSIGGDGSGVIPTAKHGKLIGYTNLALLRLHSRFLLKENDLLLRQSEHIRTYKLSSEHAATTPDPVVPVFPAITKYILDTPIKPFTNDVVKVITAVGYGGLDVPFNDPENPYSLFTPAPNTVQVPFPIEGTLIGIGYQASHPVLTQLTDDIILPSTLHEALISYIAHLTYSHMNGQEHTAKANEHLNKYEMVCLELEEMDLISSSHSQTNIRFHKGGWI